MGSKNLQDPTQFILENLKFKHAILLHGLTQLQKLHVQNIILGPNLLVGLLQERLEILVFINKISSRIQVVQNQNNFSFLQNNKYFFTS